MLPHAPLGRGHVVQRWLRGAIHALDHAIFMDFAVSLIR